MSTLGKGYVHIYTGTGKGKTTAALGLALRAAGHGLRSCMIQFMKGQDYGELTGARMLGGLFTVEQFGDPEFCRPADMPLERHVRLAQAGLERLHAVMRAGACEILIADEAITAMLFKLLREEDLLGVIEARPVGMELVLTGRGATPGLIERADLVTEMQAVKHYYTRGILSRPGIEN